MSAKNGETVLNWRGAGGEWTVNVQRTGTAVAAFNGGRGWTVKARGRVVTLSGGPTIAWDFPEALPEDVVTLGRTAAIRWSADHLSKSTRRR